MFGRNWKDAIKSEAMKLRCVALQARSVSFISGNQNGFSGASQQPREFFIKRRNSFARVNDPNQRY